MSTDKAPARWPYLAWFVSDWLGDPKVSMCEPATRGILFDLLCNMHLLDRSGQITGTREQLARAGRCTAVQLDAALQDLQQTNAADVTERNGQVTVTNRRMRREFCARKSGATRAQRHRERSDGNGDVTGQLHSPVPESESKESKGFISKPSVEGGSGGKRAATAWRKMTAAELEIASAAEAALNGGWAQDSRKWLDRITGNPGNAEKKIAPIKAEPERVRRVFADVAQTAREGEIRTTPAQFAEWLWGNKIK